VGRDRNIGPATIQQYQLTVAIVEKSHSKVCSDCTFVFSVDNYEKIFGLHSSYS